MRTILFSFTIIFLVLFCHNRADDSGFTASADAASAAQAMVDSLFRGSASANASSSSSASANGGGRGGGSASANSSSSSSASANGGGGSASANSSSSSSASAHGGGRGGGSASANSSSSSSASANGGNGGGSASANSSSSSSASAHGGDGGSASANSSSSSSASVNLDWTYQQPNYPDDDTSVGYYPKCHYPFYRYCYWVRVCRCKLRYGWWDTCLQAQNEADPNSVDPADYSDQAMAQPADLNDSGNSEYYNDNCDDYFPHCYFPYYRQCYWVRRCYCRHRWLNY